ncbi:cytochrome P450 [Hydrocarboniphaga sp.]|uniref:cytochrome P450 n=1 Tax=Hydrocarboniphaga sp. TaxID=2033016 RepID=UPI002632DF8A|nr:cytochrome P450 [Hydrocarboniphaga sp.]
MLLDRAVLENPYPFYLQLQTQAPVWRVPGTEVFVVTSYALLEEAAARVEDFSSNMRCLLYRDEDGLPARLSFGEAGIQALATADPPSHGVHKRAVFPEFVGKRMSLLEPEIAELATSLVERAIDRRNVDFMAEVGNLIPITVINRLIGFRNSNLERLLQTAFDSTALVGGALSQQQLFECVGRSVETQSWIAEQVAAAAAEPGDDILTSIRNGVESGAFSASEGTGILMILLAAGGESTTSLLGNAVRILADNAELQQKLRQQPDLIPAFVEEVLRLEAPFRSMLRSVPKDTTLGGVEIPAGSTVLLFWSAGNRDPAAFENPEELVLERPRRHLTFGKGIHHCVGAPLARIEGRTVLSVLLERTSSFTLDADQPPQWVESLQVRRYERLPLTLVPR